MKSSMSATFSALWQLNDWNALSLYSLEQLEGHDEGGEMALMVAIACLQLGRHEQAIKIIEWSLDQGATPDMRNRYLIAGAFYTLAKARWLQSDQSGASSNLSAAHQIIQPNTELSSSMLNAQLKAMFSVPASVEVKPEILSVTDLGAAWAGNTVNTVIFRHHAVFTNSGCQYTAFYVDTKTLRIIKRELKDNKVQTYDLVGDYNLKDAHNSISLGMDRQGYLHISFDHHGTQLNYRRTIEPYQIDAWTDNLPMTGNKEGKVTYPTFILPQADTPLLILYRDGNWKQGQAYFKYYDEALQSWFDYPTPILSGAEQKPWSSNAYWNHPAMDKQGVLHLSFTWRTDYFSEEELVSNINVDYAKSYDHGLSWYTSQNQPYRLPITPANSETVWPISPGSNHINQTSMALDSKGYPHIVFYANDQHGVPQYQHLWFDGKTWQKTQISQRIKAFKLLGGGTLEIPISRPEIVIDQDDTVFVLYRSQETKQKLVATYLQAPDYVVQPENTLVLWDEPVGQAEPIIDRTRWEQERVLTLFVQYNEQPNGEGMPNESYKKIQLIDFRFGERL